MAFFSPLSALSAFAGGVPQGMKQAREDDAQRYDLMGMEALGRAFQQPQMQPTVPPIPGISPQGPQAPPPGQPSVPAQPVPPAGPPRGLAVASGGPVGPPTAPPAGGMLSGTAGGAPMPPGFVQGGPASPQQMAAAFASLRQGQGTPIGGYQPPQAPQRTAQVFRLNEDQPPAAQQQAPQMPQQQAPMGMFDLQTIATRIQQANPGLPPQAMVSALLRAAPLLNIQGRHDLAQLRQQMQGENLNLRREALDLRREVSERKDERADDMKGQATEIWEAMKRGEQPPTMTGLYRLAPEVRAVAAADKSGASLAKMQQEWSRAQKQILSLNGPQMVRYQGLANSVVNTIDEVNALAKQMDNSGVPLLNHAKMVAYAQTQGNTPQGQLVAKYLAAVNTLKEEFANLAQGGYAPTEAAWTLANQQINADYGVKQLGAALGEVQRLIRYRLEGIPGINTLGTQAPNRYVPGGTGSGAGSTMAPHTGAGGGAAPDPLGIR